MDPESDADANKLSATAKHYLIVDTNVALSQVTKQPNHRAALIKQQCGIAPSGAWNVMSSFVSFQEHIVADEHSA